FAVLQREMDFAALLRINVTGVTVNALCAVGLSLAGWSYLGLAWASVAGQVATSLAAACYRPERAHYLPSMRGAGEVFRFGSPI
ncbi:oligosaccharide flippase family protein, partial [Klebsiella pneumoniae]|nr:oligosaccharide flippase family protein [Klebsiella pneumoniae]